MNLDRLHTYGEDKHVTKQIEKAKYEKLDILWNPTKVEKIYSIKRFEAGDKNNSIKELLSKTALVMEIGAFVSKVDVFPPRTIKFVVRNSNEIRAVKIHFYCFYYLTTLIKKWLYFQAELNEKKKFSVYKNIYQIAELILKKYSHWNHHRL